MEAFVKLIAGGGAPVALLFVCAMLILVMLVSVLYFIAFYQGRSISFWPPKIGERTDVVSSTMVETSLAEGAMLSRNEESPPSFHKLTEFLGMPREGGRVGIVVSPKECIHRPDIGKPYKAMTVSFAHMQAVVEIVNWLAKPRSIDFEPQELFVPENDVGAFSGSTLFLVGGPLANKCVNKLVPVIESESQPGRTTATPKQSSEKKIYVIDSGDKIHLICRGTTPDCFFITPPRGDTDIRDVEAEITYGCIMKESKTDRTTFAIWGLDARGTRGAARWLFKHWEQMQQERVFTAILRFQADSTYAADDVESHRSESGILVPKNTSYT